VSDTETARPHLRRWIAALAAVGVVVIGVAYATTFTEDRGGSAWTTYAAGWTQLPAPPEWRYGAGIVWTGSQLLYWGGANSAKDVPPSDEGYAFDPVAATWSAMPTAPEPGAPAAAIWTGSQALFFMPDASGVRVLAFDPATSTWRAFDRGPRGPVFTSSFTWTGRGVLVFGGAIDRQHGSAKAWMFDPSDGSWMQQPSAPVAVSAPVATWDGQQVIIVGWSGDILRTTAATLQVQAFNVLRPSWSTLPDTGLEPVPAGVGTTDGRTIVWQPVSSSSLEWSGTSGSWTTLTGPDVEAHDCPVDTATIDGFIFGWNCGSPALWSAATSSWSAVDPPMASGSIVTTAYGYAIGAGEGFVVDEREPNGTAGNGGPAATVPHLWFWEPPPS
jgi:hypothetical protein